MSTFGATVTFSARHSLSATRSRDVSRVQQRTYTRRIPLVVVRAIAPPGAVVHAMRLSLAAGLVYTAHNFIPPWAGPRRTRFASIDAAAGFSGLTCTLQTLRGPRDVDIDITDFEPVAGSEVVAQMRCSGSGLYLVAAAVTLVVADAPGAAVYDVHCAPVLCTTVIANAAVGDAYPHAPPALVAARADGPVALGYHIVHTPLNTGSLPSFAPAPGDSPPPPPPRKRTAESAAAAVLVELAKRASP